jgi:phosphotransferase system enzyme I (PtsI)
LTERGVEIVSHLPIGVMIETPAAALLAQTFSERVDFLSIGTNDLAQYTLATDRTNELVADIFDAMHPAVVQLIAMAVRAAQTAGIPVSVCGELAGHAAATELLIGLGIRELSVAPSLALELKHRIRLADSRACARAVTDVLTCTSTTDVYSILQSLQSGNHGSTAS